MNAEERNNVADRIKKDRKLLNKLLASLWETEMYVKSLVDETKETNLI